MHLWLTSASADFKIAQLIQDNPISRAFLPFSLPPARYRSHFPHYRRTSPALASKCRRAIHRFDRANSVTICAAFLANPRKRTFV